MKKNYKRLKWVVLIILAGLIFLLAKSASAATLITNHRKAPQQQITGTVNGVDNLPLPGVTVSIKGQTRGTITDFEGNYSITASIGDVLVFSFLGYKKQEIPVDDRIEIDIQLKEDINSLEAVEINAGYYNTTRRESTGNISRITAKTIEQQPVLNPLAAMQGRMPGVQITQTTGVPGGGFDIKIRGTNSLRAEGNAPLFIIDGVPFSQETLSSGNLSGGILSASGLSPLNGINAADIASIEVLKDADATAIYGSRGANGVVLITTKKGKPGATKFSINANSGFGALTKKLDLMSTAQYLEMRKEAYANDGVTEYPYYAYDLNGTWNMNRYTDWQEKLIGNTAKYNQVFATVSGGSDATQFLISGGHQNQTTVFPGDSRYGKTSAHVSLNHVSKDRKFRLDYSGSYVADKDQLPVNDFKNEAQQLPPNAPPIFDENGNLNWANSSWDNPYRLLEEEYKAETNNLFTNLKLSYLLLPGLNVSSSLGYSFTNLNESRTVPSTIYDPAYGLGGEYSSLYLNNSSRSSWIVEPQISYTFSKGDSRIDALVGATFQEQSSEKRVVSGQGFSTNILINDIGAASHIYVQGNEESLYRYTAIYGRIGYNLKERYYLNLTGRRDGSSRFGPGKKFANFGAIGAAWIFTDESFFKETSTILSFGKLRGSYGITGNDQIGDYQFLDTYSSNGIYNSSVGLQPTRLVNPNFRWEKNKKFEVGLELGWFQDRLFTNISYFRNISSNQLVGIPLPGTTGFSSLQANLDATVENKGWEIELESQIIRGKYFTWGSSLNISFLHNKLLKFPGLEQSTYASIYEIGKSLSINHAYEYTGINTDTGIYTFKDFNGDGIISYLDDHKLIVDTTPDYFGGLTNSFTYKNWSIDFLLQFVKQRGQNFIIGGTPPGSRSNQPTALLDRWQKPGDVATYQKFTAGLDPEASDAFNNFSISNAAYTDASYIRLKNISLSYTIPESWNGLFKTKLYIQGQNLLTITSYKGADPETQATYSIAPLSIITGGFTLTF